MSDKVRKRIDTIRQKYLSDHLWPDEVYKREISEYAGENQLVGHLGCGRDIQRIYEATGDAKVIGFDLDTESLKDYETGEKARADLSKLPVSDNTFDLLVCEFVFEHIEKPERVISECSRVLKPGGKMIFLTINRFSPFCIISSLTPDWFHRLVRRNMLDPLMDDDTFRTYYRLNSAGKVRKLFKSYGMCEVSLQYLESEITYFDKYPILFEIGCMYGKFLINHQSLRKMRTYLMGIYQKVSE